MSEKRLIDRKTFIEISSFEPTTAGRLFNDLPKPTLADVTGTQTLDSVIEETNKILEDLLGCDTAFPTIDILTRLIDATDKLLHHCSYDGTGWEVLQESMEFAKKRIEAFKQAHKYLIEKGFNVFGEGK